MPSSPSSLPSALVLLFAVACGPAWPTSITPSRCWTSSVPSSPSARPGSACCSARPAGCALALLLVVPLGDLLERRRLMFVQLLLLVLSLLLVGFAGDTLGLALGLLGLGLLGTAMTQGLLAYAAALAAPGERGRVVGAARGGVVIGLLLARSLAGLLADLGGWRSVYLVSAASMGGLGLLLWRVLPAAPSNELGLTYRQLLGSMFGLLASQRVLQVRGLLGLLMFAAFGGSGAAWYCCSARRRIRCRTAPSAPSAWSARSARWARRGPAAWPIAATPRRSAAAPCCCCCCPGCRSPSARIRWRR